MYFIIIILLLFSRKRSRAPAPAFDLDPERALRVRHDRTKNTLLLSLWRRLFASRIHRVSGGGSGGHSSFSRRAPLSHANTNTTNSHTCTRTRTRVYTHTHTTRAHTTTRRRRLRRGILRADYHTHARKHNALGARVSRLCYCSVVFVQPSVYVVIIIIIFVFVFVTRRVKTLAVRSPSVIFIISPHPPCSVYASKTFRRGIFVGFDFFALVDFPTRRVRQWYTVQSCRSAVSHVPPTDFGRAFATCSQKPRTRTEHDRQYFFVR